MQCWLFQFSFLPVLEVAMDGVPLGYLCSALCSISLPGAVVSLRVMHDLPERAELRQC